MHQTKLVGISVKNGSRYPLFKTNKVTTHEALTRYKIRLQRAYKAEFYLYTCDVDSEYNLPNNTVPLEELEKHLIPEVNNQVQIAIM